MASSDPTQFKAAFRPKDKKSLFTELEYTIPELVRAGDSVQIDHPCGVRLLAPLPPDAPPGTQIIISVPAASDEFPPLVAVKAESIVNGTVGGIKTMSSTALKVMEWKENTKTCQLCEEKFGIFHFRRHHHCRVCGASVCSACSPNVKSVPGYHTDQRVCNKCIREELMEIIAPTADA